VKVEKLVLRQFRNISESEYYPASSINFILGDNGQGKTSTLEALGFLSSLRSFRGSKTPEVIQWGANQAEVSCVLVSGLSEAAQDWKTDLKVVFSYTDPEKLRASKVAFINNKPFKSSTQYMSQRFSQFQLGFHSVTFNPSDHDLVRGDPATRRSYIDQILSAEDSNYLLTLQRYKRILDQRNAWLKSSETPSRDVLAGFSESMTREGAYLAYKRLEWLSKLQNYLNEIVHKIAPKQPLLRMFYVSSWVPEIAGLSLISDDLSSRHFAGHSALPSLEHLEQAFSKKLASLEAAELRARHSLVGPQRDDWMFTLGTQILKGHGSQGETRSALLALKLSEVELFRNTTGHLPIFLLDDFSSELDRERRSFLLDFLDQRDLQVFVTTTEDSFSVGKQVWVVNGDFKNDIRASSSEITNSAKST
jgi:DNA replication and repair protein RecF